MHLHFARHIYIYISVNNLSLFTLLYKIIISTTSLILVSQMNTQALFDLSRIVASVTADQQMSAAFGKIQNSFARI